MLALALDLSMVGYLTGPEVGALTHNAAVSMSAIARGIELDRLETDVSIEWDPFVFLHLEDIEDGSGEPVDMFGDLAVDIEVAGDGLDEADRRYLEESVGRSAVYNLVTLAHACEPSVRLTGPSETN